jgi:hypothetical protein
MICFLFKPKEQRMPRPSAARLFFRMSERPWIPDAPTGGASEYFAEAATGAWLYSCMYLDKRAAGWPASAVAPRKRFPRKNGSGHCCQERVLILLLTTPFSFSVILRIRALACCYFPEGAAPASLVVQNAVSGVVKEQTQLEVGQGLVRLHVPPQVVP